MPKTTSWREIRARRPPNEAVVAQEKLKIRLALLREQFGQSQAEFAERLGTSQPNVSQLERSEDLQVSSIAKYVHALGGQLQVNAVIGEATFPLIEDVESDKTWYRVMVFQGKARPGYVRSFGLFGSPDDAWAAVEREGYSTIRSDDEWAVVAP
jgi:transcriptional regulator with XRE-family HTH domain